MNGLNRVEPGDLITAAFMNSLIDMVTDLRQRVTNLESGVAATSKARITAFNPPGPPDGQGQALGQVMQIFGEPFAFPPQNNTVTIQNFLVSSGGLATVKQFRPGSNPKMLELVIPTNIAGIQPGGTDVTITVNTGESSTQRTYRLGPALPTTGQPPQIDSIAKLDGSFNLSVNQIAVIKGQNFATAAAGNKITIVIPTDTGEVRYPDPTDPLRNQPIQMISANPIEIQFLVPDMQEVDVNGIDCSIELQVGNFPSVERVVNISRG